MGCLFTSVLEMVELPNNLFPVHQGERGTGLPPRKMPCRFGSRLSRDQPDVRRATLVRMQKLCRKEKTSGHGNCRQELLLLDL